MAKALATLFLIVAVTMIALTSATEYYVGDSSGWTNPYDYGQWLQGKSFVAGDVLVFSYDNSAHNVIASGPEAYDMCDAASYLAMYNSGNDRLILQGDSIYYFFCQWHCLYNQKISITVP